jgi:hypothetical protein
MFFKIFRVNEGGIAAGLIDKTDNVPLKGMALKRFFSVTF